MGKKSKNTLMYIVSGSFFIFAIFFLAWPLSQYLREHIGSHGVEKFAKVDRDLLDISLILVKNIAQTGHWPSTVKEVETALSDNSSGSFDLKTLLVDPYSGDRLIIKCSPRKIWIYSVGPDGIDQGGTIDLTPSTQAHLPGDIVLKISQSAEDTDIINITHRGVTQEVRKSEIR